MLAPPGGPCMLQAAYVPHVLLQIQSRKGTTSDQVKMHACRQVWMLMKPGMHVAWNASVKAMHVTSYAHLYACWQSHLLLLEDAEAVEAVEAVEAEELAASDLHCACKIEACMSSGRCM